MIQEMEAFFGALRSKIKGMKKHTKTPPRKDAAAVALGRRGGLATAKSLTPEQRSASARHAVLARYGKTQPLEAQSGEREGQR